MFLVLTEREEVPIRGLELALNAFLLGHLLAQQFRTPSLVCSHMLTVLSAAGHACTAGLGMPKQDKGGLEGGRTRSTKSMAARWLWATFIAVASPNCSSIS